MKKILILSAIILASISCKKDAGPDYTSEYLGKYDNGALLINGTGLGTPSQAISTHTVSRVNNNTLQIETEIRSISTTTLANTGKAVIRASSTVKYVKVDGDWTIFESDGRFIKAHFRKINNRYDLNIGIVQSDGTKIDNSVAVRN